MTKLSASIFVVFALFAIVSAEQFQRINFDQGKLRLRTLDTASSVKSVDFINYNETALNTTAVNVNFGTEYNTKAEIDTTKASTEMMILLSGSSTAFCTNCGYIKNFVCPSNDCKADTTTYLQTIHPFYYASRANPFTFNVTIGPDATNWQLKSSALLYTSSYEQTKTVTYPGTGGYYYPQNHSTYGFIGMGVDGDSVKNFQGDHPLFSIISNGTGTGQLIFGKDTTKYDSTKTSQAITTDTNWTMSVKNISAGPDQVVLSSYQHKLIFDLNFPGLGLSSYYYSNVLAKLMTRHGVVSNSTLGNTRYPYVYTGDITLLSSITFELSNGQNLTIPPQAYTQKLADNVYAILIQSGGSDISTNVYSKGSSEWVYFNIIGSSIMSNFYTVFEKTTTGQPTITLYPTYGGASSGNTTTPTTTSSWKTILIIVIVVLVALVVISVAAKKKNLTKSDLGVELRAARV